MVRTDQQTFSQHLQKKKYKINKTLNTEVLDGSYAYELSNTYRIALALMKDMFTILLLIFCENLAATSATWNLNIHSREPGI